MNLRRGCRILSGGLFFTALWAPSILDPAIFHAVQSSAARSARRKTWLWKKSVTTTASLRTSALDTYWVCFYFKLAYGTVWKSNGNILAMEGGIGFMVDLFPAAPVCAVLMSHTFPLAFKDPIDQSHWPLIPKISLQPLLTYDSDCPSHRENNCSDWYKGKKDSQYA